MVPFLLHLTKTSSPFFLSFSYPFPFYHPFHLENTSWMSSFPWELQHWPYPCGGCCIPPLGFLIWGCSWTLGRNFMELGNLHFPFSFSLFASQTGADTPCLSGGTEGGAWPPNHSKSIQWGPTTLGGLPWLGGLSSPCFVCSVHVPRAFGWLPPVRLHCPVPSQPPGDRMLPGFGSCCSVSLSCHCLCPCQQAVSWERGLLTHSQSPQH